MNFYEARNDKAAADKALEAGLKNCPESPALLMMKGLQYKDHGNIPKALEYLKRSAELRPNESRAFIYISHIYFGQNDNDQGRIYMEKALQAEPANTMALNTLTFLAILQKDKAKADEYFMRMSYQPRMDPMDMEKLLQNYKATFGTTPPQ